MTGAFEISNECGEACADESGPAFGFVDGSIVDLFALATPASMRAKPDHGDHFARHHEIDLLENLGRFFAWHDGTVAIGTFEAMEFGVVDVLVSKRRSLVQRMAGLSADLTFATVFRLGLGLLDKIAGGGLGRVA